MNTPTQAVILCGGRGERLRPLTDQLPKPMAPVLGLPFLQYILKQLKDENFCSVILLTGYRGDQIAQHFGDGHWLGLRLQYSHGPDEWETGRRLAEAALLLDERFALLYGDNLAPFRLQPLWECHRAAGAALTVTLAHKPGGNIRLATSGKIELYDPKRTAPGLDYVEIGYMIADRDSLLKLNPGAGSFARVIEQLAQRHALAGYSPGCDYCSISDLTRLAETEEILRPRRVILLDRDGVLNRKAPRGEYVATPEEFAWIEANISGLQHLAKSGFEFIVLSNQAGIGRGIITAEQVDKLHRWMVDALWARGIKVRDVFVCPHHWLDHCGCRKPLPGLFFQASARHRFWLANTLYIGDDPRDVLAAHHATCASLLVGEPGDHPVLAEPLPPHHSAPDISAAVPWILQHFADIENAVGSKRSS